MTEEEEAEFGALEYKVVDIVRYVLWQAYKEGGVKALWEACHEEGRHGMHRYDPVCDEVYEVFALGPAYDNYIIAVPVAELKERSLEAVREECRQRLAYDKEEGGLCAGMTRAEQKAAEAEWEKDVEVILQVEKALQGILDKEDGVRGVLRYMAQQEEGRRGKWGSAWINFTAERMQIELSVPSIANYCDPKKKTVFTVSLGSAFGQGELEARLEAFCQTGALERKYRKVSPFVLRCVEDIAEVMEESRASMELVFRLVREEIRRLAAPGGGVPMYSVSELAQLRREKDDEVREQMYGDMENGKRDALEIWRKKYLVDRVEGVSCAAEEERSGGTVSVKVKTASERDWIAGTIGRLVGDGIYGGEKGGKRIRSAFFRDAVKGVIDLMTEFPVKYDAIVSVAQRVVKDSIYGDTELEVFTSGDAAKIASEPERHERMRLQVSAAGDVRKRFRDAMQECKAFVMLDNYVARFQLWERRRGRMRRSEKL